MRNRVVAVYVAIALVAGALLLLASRSASAAEIERGRALYESRCGGCHAESVHGRVNRAATDFDAVRRWVARWSDNLKLRWEAGEVDDVAAYLNIRHYKFPCPPDVCNVVSSPGPAALRQASTRP